MRKCDFCKNELTCSGVNRSECIVRDFYNFEAERTPTDDVTTITRLIMECQTLDPVAIAKYLVQNGDAIQKEIERAIPQAVLDVLGKASTAKSQGQGIML